MGRQPINSQATARVTWADGNFAGACSTSDGREAPMIKKLPAAYANRLTSSLQALDAEAMFVEAYILVDNVWEEASGGVVGADTQRGLSSFWRGKKDHERKPNTGECLFRMAALQAIVKVQVGALIKADRRDRILSALRERFEATKNEFEAKHCQLTGLANRRALDEFIQVGIDEMRGVTKDLNSAVSVSRSALFLIALDLDHFKHVNDTYGHAFGDVVLRVFANRVERVVQSFLEEVGSQIKVIAARPGGEEFGVVVSGDCTREQILSLAERIRFATASEELPTNNELVTCFEIPVDEAGVPPRTDRKVTVSVGVATIERIGDASTAAIAGQLQKSADAALYSAKLGGRNRVRAFEEIIERYGHIIEINESAGVVAIDIGSDVGVRRGQEFFVVPPNFDGVTEYYTGEGRTRKRIGVFPRTRAGRLVVFDVQPAVAFCKVVSMEPYVKEFAAGSTLESIPLGAISHLLSKSALDAPLGVYDIERLTKRLEVEAGTFSLILVALDNISQVAEVRGASVANAAIATVARELLSECGAGTTIAQLGVHSIVALTTGINPGIEETLRQISERFRKAFGDDPPVWMAIVPSTIVSDFPAVQRTAFLPLALVAETEARQSANSVYMFDADTPQSFIWHARQEKRFEQAYADYERLKAMGVVNGATENQAGLVCYERSNRDIDAAIAHFRMAISVDSGPHMYKANLVLMLVIKGDHAAAADLVDEFGPSLNSVPKSYCEAMLYAMFIARSGSDFAAFVKGNTSTAKKFVETDTTVLGLNRTQFDSFKAHVSAQLAI